MTNEQGKRPTASGGRVEGANVGGASPRTKALLMSLTIPLAGGVFVGGYIIGSHAEHPNSVFSQVLTLFVGWVFGFVWLLWIATDHGQEVPDV